MNNGCYSSTDMKCGNKKWVCGFRDELKKYHKYYTLKVLFLL